MWGDWLEKGKNLANKAQAAALDLDKQLNESVGIDTPATNQTTAATTVTTTTSAEDDEALNDAWAEDEFVQAPSPARSPSSVPPAPSSTEQLLSLSKKVAASVVAPVSATEEQKPAEEPDQGGGEGWGGDDNLVFDDVGTNDAAVEEKPTPELEQLGPPEQPEAVAVKQEPEPEPDVPTSVPEPEVQQEKPSVETQEPKAAANVPESLEAAVSAAPDAEGWAGDDNDLEMLDEITDEPEPAVVQQDEKKEVVLAEEETNLEAPSVPEEKPVANGDGLNQVEVESQPLVVSSPSETKDEHPASTPSVVPDAASTLSVVPDAASAPESAPPTPSQVVQEQLVQQKQQFEQQLHELRNILSQRENQLVSKTEQMATMEAMHETEKLELQQRVRDTKDEAKRRIQKAKERVQAMEEQLQTATSSQSAVAEDASKQAGIIAALRQEGEKLAHKQADMEKAVRTAKGEARELRVQLEDETIAKENALEKISKLEAELKQTKEDLTSARKGESQADKLEEEVRKSKEDAELKAATILSLEQQIKELKSEKKELKEQLEEAQKGAAIESQREQKKMARERNDAVSDLENKLRTSEREAAVREDALRHEVAELRKRWQDAVRRADSLSMDVQSSTAPLLRQLESADRQNRARAAAWSELENSLRAELEENVIANEKLSKERSEWKTKFTRLERAASEKDSELKSAKTSLEDKTYRVKQLEEKLETMEEEGAKMKEEWAEVERLANEGVSRVRSEMTQTVVESEERHQSQMESLKAELRRELEKRTQLERQVDELVEKSGLLVPAEVQPQQTAVVVQEAAPVKLRQSMGQVDILTGALDGLGGDEDEVVDEEEILTQSNGTGSFAALAELTSRLKASNMELNTLRRSLAESERSREKMVEELAEGRTAREKLPLFETRVRELTVENQELTLEVQALREDITEVRELYRTQLNVLLEEKAAANSTHGVEDSNPGETTEQVAENPGETAVADEEPQTASATP